MPEEGPAVAQVDTVDRAPRVLGHVVVDNFPAQGLTDAELRAAAVETWISNWPASYTISNFPASFAISNFPATQPVSGTFWQATQPVSIATMPSTPVTGAFWQSTQPVSIAAQVKAREDTAAMTWVSLKTAAPSANAVQADTGTLAAGDYDFDIFLCASDTVAVGKGLVVEHRNAANAATLFNLAAIPAGASDAIQLRRFTIATNERIRVIVGTAAGAASSMYVSAIGRRVA